MLLGNLFDMTSQSSVWPNMGVGGGTGRSGLQGVSRAVRLLNAMAAAGGEGLSLNAAARQIEATKSSVLTRLRTLIDFDYVTL